MAGAVFPLIDSRNDALAIDIGVMRRLPGIVAEKRDVRKVAVQAV